MAKKMLSLEEIETQLVLELPDRQLMRAFVCDRGGGGSCAPVPLITGGGEAAQPGFVFSANAPEVIGGGN
jgi:hypothetical protein